ncbi:2693_t:CDS:10 [Entrophospora sp. SA101]|nr:18045_t:CDS:10 [Entrophospora sp. SA101]CAJ0758358.1 2693_t:CDS:10 [Entrophospora sp. SA101]CAJ0901171.1 14786_t:CDS:10 [Entrophospora sp. SA101]
MNYLSHMPIFFLITLYLLLFSPFNSATQTPLKENTNLMENSLDESIENYCAPSGLISDACCDYKTVENINNDLFPRLQELIKTDFFKYYKLNLYKECPFWHENGQCINQACAVETTDESNVPEMWRSNVLGALQTSSNGLGVFVNLLENPERFTGYAGASASRVWKSIYEENCFNVAFHLDPSYNIKDLSSAPTNKKPLGLLLQSKNDIYDEICVEKRVYYRLISGLHSSISIHICSEYLNKTTGLWGPNLDCFVDRIGSYPERLQNAYFNYVVLLRAISKISNYLKGYEFCTGDELQDEKVKSMVNEIVDRAQSCPETFDENQLFASPESSILKEEFKSRFRNVSRIMDCVGCDKCRLWGKVQISGIGTALKILFSYEDDFLNPKIDPNLLRRTEIVALFNTFSRFSESLKIIEKFRKMYQQHKLNDINETNQINQISQQEKVKKIEFEKSINQEILDESNINSSKVINEINPSSSFPNMQFVIELWDFLKSKVSPYIIQFRHLITQRLEYWYL